MRGSDPLIIAMAGLFASSTCAFAQSTTVATASADSNKGPASSNPSADKKLEQTSEIIITGHAETAVSKTGTPLLDVPQDIQFISSRLIKDQGASVLEDALRNVAGVSVGGYARAYDFYRIRGFEAWQYALLDGLPRTVSLNIEPNALERVEVIKGPASVLYGRGAPGGFVNLISKRPQDEPFADLSLTGGSFDTFIGTADVDRPLTSNDSLTGRFVGVYRREGSHIKYTKGVERLYLAPSLRWRFSSRGDITLLGSWTQEWNVLVPAQPATGYILPNPNGRLPRDLYIEDPKQAPIVHQRHRTLGYALNFAFNDVLSFHQDVRATWTNLHWMNIYQPLALGADQRTLTIYDYDLKDDTHNIGADSRLAAVFNTGAVAHRLTGGFEYEHGVDHRIDYLGGFFPPIQFDLFAPDYSIFQRPSMFAIPSYSKTDSYALYLQEEATFLRTLTLTLGGRYEWDRVGNGTTTARYHSFVPRVGLNYRIAPSLAAYVSYSKSFNPQAGLRDVNGNPVQPERGEQYEAGLKLLTADGRFNATAAIYQITRSNVATPRVTPPGTYDVSGKQRSRGFELDAQFRPVPPLQLIASYAYTHATVLQDNFLPHGNWTLNSPRNTVSVWAKYTLLNGPLKGLGASLGGSYYSKQAGDTANSFFLPQYALLNGNISYEKGPVRLQLNVYNITNKYAAIGSLLPLFVTYATPRAYRLTLGYKF